MEQAFVPVVGSSLRLPADNTDYLKVKLLYGKTHDIEVVIGTAIDLRKLADNQSVVAGDMKSFHFRLTKREILP